MGVDVTATQFHAILAHPATVIKFQSGHHQTFEKFDSVKKLGYGYRHEAIVFHRKIVGVDLK